MIKTYSKDKMLIIRTTALAVIVLSISMVGCGKIGYISSEYKARPVSIERSGSTYSVVDNKEKSKLLVGASFGRAMGHAFVKGASLYTADIGGEENEYRLVVDDYLARDRVGCKADDKLGEFITAPWWEFKYQCGLSKSTLVPAEFPPSNIFKSSSLPERRIALVIGNSRYRNLPRLDNPRNDAELIATTLNKLGFTIIGGKALLDLDRTNLENAVKAFSEALQQGDSASRTDNSVGLGNRKNDGSTSSVVALFYYAGHGIQARGENYLIPVDANPTKESDFDFQLTNVNLVLRQMERAATALNMVILDACRNNPIGGRGLRSSGNGLAEMKAPEGTLIAFATQSGNVAQDGPSGSNSPFAQALAWGIQQPGLDQFGTFNTVAVRVKKITAGAQQPWMSNSPIEGQFVFVPK